jgi:TetR/AcrR family transcriptional regulator
MSVKERKARDFRRREKEILSAAYELLTDLEPIQMTMEMIAEKAEIGRGTIYKHFKSKDDIYVHLILRRRGQYIVKLNKILKDSGNLLQKLIRSYMGFCTDDPVAFAVQQKCVNHYSKSNLGKKLIASLRLQDEEKVSLVEAIMEKSLGELSVIPENSKYLIYAGWGMISGAMELMMDNRFNSKRLDEESYSKAVEQIFLSGIPTVSS